METLYPDIKIKTELYSEHMSQNNINNGYRVPSPEQIGVDIKSSKSVWDNYNETDSDDEELVLQRELNQIKTGRHKNASLKAENKITIENNMEDILKGNSARYLQNEDLNSEYSLE